MSLPVIDPRMAAQSAYSEDPTQKKLQLDAVRKSVAGGANKEKQMREACQGFESIFLQKMWEQMRNNVPKEGYLHSREEEIYQSMFDTELAKKMSSAGGIGLADMLYEQLNQKLGQASRGTSISMINKNHSVKSLDEGQGGIPLKPNYGALLQTPEAASAEANQVLEGNKVAGLYNKAVEPGLEGEGAAMPNSVPGAADKSASIANLTSGNANPDVKPDMNSDAKAGVPGVSGVPGAIASSGKPGEGAAVVGSAQSEAAVAAGAVSAAVSKTAGATASNAAAVGQSAGGSKADSGPLLVRFAPQNNKAAAGEQAASEPKAEPVLMDIPGFSGMKKPFAQPFSEPVANMPMFDTVETVIPYRRSPAATAGASQAATDSPVSGGIGIPEGEVTPLSKPAPVKIQEFGQNLGQDSGQDSGLNGGNLPAGMFKTFDKIPDSI